MNKTLEIVAGNSFEWLILVRDINKAPLDMTDYIAKGDIKIDYDDDLPVDSFDIEILAKSGVLAAISNGTLHLTTSEIAGLEPETSGLCYLHVQLNSAKTSSLNGEYVYDIELIDTFNYTFKPYRGQLNVLSEVTTEQSS